MNYGSRLDRIYVRDLVNNIADTINIPVSWSDHCMIKTSFKLDNVSQFGNWRVLNSWPVICNYSEKLRIGL